MEINWDKDPWDKLLQTIQEGKFYPDSLMEPIEIPVAVSTEPNEAVKALLAQLARQTEAQERQAVELHLHTDELRRQADELQRQADELRRQAEAQESIHEQLKEEAADRAHDDKKYFWLGALVSLVTALLVECGAALLSLLQ